MSLSPLNGTCQEPEHQGEAVVLDADACVYLFITYYGFVREYMKMRETHNLAPTGRIRFLSQV